MKYKIEFEPQPAKVMAKWQKSNPYLFKKTSKLLDEIALHPREGTGHPEPLVNGGGIYYSRRINGPDRIVYMVIDQEVKVLVIQLGGHYDDK